MDPRTKTILEYAILGSQLWFTWYINNQETVTTQFYFGRKKNVTVPKKI